MTVPVAPGRHALGLAPDRDGLFYVPALGEDRPAPLAVMLHGAGGRGRISPALEQIADDLRIVILAPDSRAVTWDVVSGRLGPDVEFLDAALAHVFARVAVDPKRLAIAGFSDGASYALTLGTVNDLFSHILAFSPGFMARPGPRRGSPRIFVSHGRRDEILPIDRTSRRLVPMLEEEGYRVVYCEFDGPHTVPPDIARQAFEWFAR